MLRALTLFTHESGLNCHLMHGLPNFDFNSMTISPFYSIISHRKQAGSAPCSITFTLWRRLHLLILGGGEAAAASVWPKRIHVVRGEGPSPRPVNWVTAHSDSCLLYGALSPSKCNQPAASCIFLLSPIHRISALTSAALNTGTKSRPVCVCVCGSVDTHTQDGWSSVSLACQSCVGDRPSLYPLLLHIHPASRFHTKRTVYNHPIFT